MILLQLPSLCMKLMQRQVVHVTSTLSTVHISHCCHNAPNALQVQGQGSLALHNAESFPSHGRSTYGQKIL